MLFDATTKDTFLNIFEGAPEKVLRAGDTLIHAGAEAEYVYNILEGTLMVSRIGNDGRRQVMSFLFPDNFIGLTTDRYFFAVQAVTPARVVARPRRQLENRLEEDPEAGRAFLNMVYRVLENSMDLVYSLGQRTATERVAVFLLYLRNRHKIASNLNDESQDLALIDLPMSRQDIADFLGLKKETVSRSFTQLDEKGLISRPDNSHAVIDDLQQLRQLAGIQDFSSPLRPALADRV